jgi:hypothetical protein
VREREFVLEPCLDHVGLPARRLLRAPAAHDTGSAFPLRS